MSEWLTTGQMIDRLKVGEKAEPMEFPIEGAFQKDCVLNNGNKFEWDYNGKQFFINDFTNGIKWKITPNYVSFDEAIKALKEGKLAHFHPNKNTSITAHKKSPLQTWFNQYTWDDIVFGNWTIEND